MGASAGKSKNNSSQQSMNSANNQSVYDSTSNSTFNQNVLDQQLPFLSSLYGQANSLSGNGTAVANSLVPGAQELMNNVSHQALNANNSQMQGGVYKSMDNAGMLKNSLAESLANPSSTQRLYQQIMGGEGNGYANAMKESYTNDAIKTAEAMNSALDTRAAAAGMGGSSRQGVAQALGYRDINSNLQNNLAKTGYDTFDKDLQQKLNIASQADSNTFNRQNLLSNMLGQQQNTINQGVGNSSAIQNLGLGQFAAQQMPWQSIQNMAGVVGGPTILNSGSSNSNTTDRSFGSSFGTGSGSSSGKGSSLSGGVGGGKGK